MNPEDLPLRDLHLPDAVGWWPLAPGWWLLAALTLIAAGFLLYRALRRYRANAARRRAIAALSRLLMAYRQSNDAVSLAGGLSQLLRRAMLAYAPRAEIAGLTGGGWLAWLDRGLAGQPFSSGPGRHLESLPYRRPGATAPDVDVDGLVRAVRERLKTPLAESP